LSPTRLNARRLCLGIDIFGHLLDH
jgi:hypothetical protein